MSTPIKGCAIIVSGAGSCQTNATLNMTAELEDISHKGDEKSNTGWLMPKEEVKYVTYELQVENYMSSDGSVPECGSELPAAFAGGGIAVSFTGKVTSCNANAPKDGLATYSVSIKGYGKGPVVS